LKIDVNVLKRAGIGAGGMVAVGQAGLFEEFRFFVVQGKMTLVVFV